MPQSKPGPCRSCSALCEHVCHVAQHALMFSSGAVCQLRVHVAICTSCIHCRVHTLACVARVCRSLQSSAFMLQPPPRAGGVASWPVWQFQVKRMSLVPMLVAACVAHAAASAATHAAWRCWRAMAMGDTPALMKELGEVVCAVSSRCFASSGVSQMEQSFCAGTTEKLVAPKCCARAI